MAQRQRIHLPKQETQEMQVRSLGQEIPLEKERQPTPVFLPGKFHGEEPGESYSPWGRRELDTTERLSAHTFITNYDFTWLSKRLKGVCFGVGGDLINLRQHIL